jgi:methylglyoxal synthase
LKRIGDSGRERRTTVLTFDRQEDATRFTKVSMPQRSRLMAVRKRIALIAHDNCKSDLVDWARYNRGTLAAHELYATGTTGRILATQLGLDVTCFRSGPLGGDQQVGAGIVEGKIDFVIFFWDPLEPHSHDVDVKALLRIAVVYNVPIACNRATADFILSSPLMREDYRRLLSVEDDTVRRPDEGTIPAVANLLEPFVPGRVTS